MTVVIPARGPVCAWAAVLTLLALSSAGRTQPSAPETKFPSDRVRYLLQQGATQDPRAEAILRDPTRVESFLVDVEIAKPPSERIGGLGILTTGRKFGRKEAKDLANILMKDETLFGSKRGTSFHPNVAFKLYRGDKEGLIVFVCFGTAKVRMLPVDDKGKPLTDKDNNPLKPIEGSFGNKNGALLRFARQCLPNDRMLQNLKEFDNLPEKPKP